jgi:myosin heavy subunit
MGVATPERAANVANLLDLVDFNEASVFLALQERFARSLVYTFLGTSLVSVNPNYPQELYTPEVQALYRGLPNWQTQRLPPHLYSIAQHAYAELLYSGGEQAQTILLTGRVGSGKTEASKHLLQFLVSMNPSSVRAEQGAGALALSERLNLALVVLEAFGNAATRENYNSSRFGLVTQLFFGARGEVIGGTFTPYLFERTRVAKVKEGERNFHVLYQLVQGATPEEKKSFVLLTANKYRYLRSGNVVSLAGVDDAGLLGALKDAFKGLKLSSYQSSIFRILSAILHLGNVSFVHDEESGAVKIKSPKVLNIVAALLVCDENTLAQTMCEAQPPPSLDDEEPPPATMPAEDMRDLIAQTIYTKLFDWMVQELNNQIRTEPTNNFVSLLDPFGFEDCDLNGLHQLSVNYASERLFSDLIETRNSEEQELYVEEGTNWERIELDDGSSARCLEVFDSPDAGIWDVVTEQTQNPNAVDVDVINSLSDSFARTQVMQRCEGRYDMFLQHRGGDVVYNVKVKRKKKRKKIF